MVALVEQKLGELARLCRAHRVWRLELFGSAAGESIGFDPDRSDLDFLVEFEPDQDLGPWLKHYFAFKKTLERLFGRPVDLVMHSALKNPYFIRSVNRTRTVLYAA
jgi:uncharacterized protein